MKKTYKCPVARDITLFTESIIATSPEKIEIHKPGGSEEGGTNPPPVDNIGDVWTRNHNSMWDNWSDDK